MNTWVVQLLAAAIAFLFGTIGYIQIRERVSSLETKMEGVWDFWKQAARDAAKILHTPHPENARRDFLIEQFVDEKITNSEIEELIEILQDILDDNGRAFGERSSASTLLRFIEKRFMIWKR